MLQTQPLPAVGPYKTAGETIYIGGLVTGGSQNASLTYPIGQNTEGKIFPFISFAHGALAGGPMLPIDYFGLLNDVASYGFVIVAVESCPWRYCINFYEDVLHAIDVCKNNQSLSSIFSQTDFNNVGILGHSMGGLFFHFTVELE